MVGTVCRVLVESPVGDRKRGITDTYVKVEFPDPAGAVREGEIVDVTILRADANGAEGALAASSPDEPAGSAVARVG